VGHWRWARTWRRSRSSTEPKSARPTPILGDSRGSAGPTRWRRWAGTGNRDDPRHGRGCLVMRRKVGKLTDTFANLLRRGRAQEPAELSAIRSRVRLPTGAVCSRRPAGRRNDPGAHGGSLGGGGVRGAPSCGAIARSGWHWRSPGTTTLPSSATGSPVRGAHERGPGWRIGGAGQYRSSCMYRLLVVLCTHVEAHDDRNR
jgi:hypothetical protein